MLVGRPGISKTYSIILYWYLSNLISTYLLDDADAENIKELTAEGKIFQNAKNIIYLSYQPNLKKKDFIELAKCQFPKSIVNAHNDKWKKKY